MRYRYYIWVTAGFVTALITSNIIAVKLAYFGELPLVGELYLPAAVIIFPIAYIFGDILTEVYGYARARQVIWIGFGCNLLAVIAIWLGGLLPAAPFWTAGTYEAPAEAQQAYQAILGFTPRLLLASFVAYLACEFLNAFVLAKLTLVTAGRRFSAVSRIAAASSTRGRRSWRATAVSTGYLGFPGGLERGAAVARRTSPLICLSSWASASPRTLAVPRSRRTSSRGVSRSRGAPRALPRSRDAGSASRLPSSPAPRAASTR